MATIHLSWAPSTDAVGVSDYLIERRPNADSAFAQIATTAGTTYEDTLLTSGQTYGYRIRAQDAAANRSGYSPVVNATAYGFADTFNRADGGLGTNWASIPEGGLLISTNRAVGAVAGVTYGSYRTIESYSDDQYSEITIPFSPSDSIGVSVRNQAGGTLYAAMYAWNSGSPLLRLIKRTGGAYSVLQSVSSPILPNGTRLRLMVVGNTLSILVDGVEKLAAYDTTISTGGTPGILITGLDAVDNWGGGNASFEAHYVSTDGDGVETYNMISSGSGHGIHSLRILRPTSPVAGHAHHFLWALPVVEEGNTTFGDAIETLLLLDAHNAYNVTIIAPSFWIEPWYGDHATDARTAFESCIVNELYPWVKANLAISYVEQNWLFGFSKSSFGEFDFIFKHPTLFQLIAAWDFPAMGMVAYNTYGSSPANNYGTDANFQANYRITNTFLDTYKTPFLGVLRIWIQGYKFWQTEVDNFHAALTAKSILHTYSSVARTEHTWGIGWAPAALDALYTMSLDLVPPPDL